jgi:hypothetical protein
MPFEHFIGAPDQDLAISTARAADPLPQFVRPSAASIVFSGFPRYPDRIDDPTNLAAIYGWHRIAFSGTWDGESIQRDFAGSMIYSHGIGSTGPAAAQRAKTACVFHPAEDYILVLTPRTTTRYRLEIWARSRNLAEQRFDVARETYLRKTRKRRGATTFSIICVDRFNAVVTQMVEAIARVFNDEQVALHYGGEEFSAWNQELLHKFRTEESGISLLRGEPGTGKTTYLRYLLLKLGKTHRFYYLPLSVYPYLANPATVGFWTSETTRYNGMRKVVIIEDAESLLMSRDNDNQERLSNLLNISDGFLADFLKMHIICTINAPIQKLDPAILRPGRLLAYREFRRLSPEKATRIAALNGRVLVPQADYSLAEIYGSAATDGNLPNRRKVIGFNHETKSHHHA